MWQRTASSTRLSPMSSICIVLFSPSPLAKLEMPAPPIPFDHSTKQRKPWLCGKASANAAAPSSFSLFSRKSTDVNV